MLEACRTCLGLIDVEESPYYEIEVDEMELSTESCRYKLLSIVPEMTLDITPKSILCAECHGSLEALFEFKEKCLKTENIITRYFQAQPGIKNFDLKDVSDFNTNNVRIIEDEGVEALFEDEVELPDTIITNVEVAQPNNAVPVSSDDINVKDETIETSFEDDALEGKVELSETVVINVKREVDLPKIVSVAKKTVPDLNFACKCCDKRFKYASELKIHLRTHIGEKPYRCEICNRCYREKYQLINHLLAHNSFRPYPCSVCDKSYYLKEELSVHERMHRKTGLYQCETCRRQFTARCSLIRHLKQLHSGVRNFECKYCKKGFFREWDLNIHMDVHKISKLTRYARNPHFSV